MAAEAAALQKQLSTIASAENAPAQPTVSEEEAPASTDRKRFIPVLSSNTFKAFHRAADAASVLSSERIAQRTYAFCAAMCRGRLDNRASDPIQSLEERDIEAMLDIVCSETSMPSIWGVRPSLSKAHTSSLKQLRVTISTFH